MALKINWTYSEPRLALKGQMAGAEPSDGEQGVPVVMAKVVRGERERVRKRERERKQKDRKNAEKNRFEIRLFFK